MTKKDDIPYKFTAKITFTFMYTFTISAIF